MAFCLSIRHYYSKSLTLNSKHNVRAMYGLLMSSQALESGSRAQELKNKNLKNWVQEALKTVYKVLRGLRKKKKKKLAFD
mmetsp:Transcript_9496/g.41043  ORF Transcript_9496/g.41043 Transcript_9496/m.41043 type:complete len:80 (+) Transcript_9496:1173-1412(+)